MDLGINTLGPRISVIDIDDIFWKCFNLLGRVVLGQTLKTDWWRTYSKTNKQTNKTLIVLISKKKAVLAIGIPQRFVQCANVVT